jgi:curved DNA-binding protein CbpA
MNCSASPFSPPLCDYSFDSLVMCGAAGTDEPEDDPESSVFVFPPVGPFLDCDSPLERVELSCLSIHSSAVGSRGDDEEDAITMATAPSSSSFVDPYQVLQVRRDATPVEIRRAYQRLALWHHPGRSTMGAIPAQERARRRQVFEVLAACYETLIDKSVRARFDALLKEAERPSPRLRSKSPPSTPSTKRATRTRQSAQKSLLPPQSMNSIPSLSTVSVGSSSDDDDDESVGSHDDNKRGGETNGAIRANGKDGDEKALSCCSHRNVKQSKRRARLDSSSHYAKSVRQYLFGAAPSISVEDDDDDNDDDAAEIHSIPKRRPRQHQRRTKSSAARSPPPPSESSSSEEEEMHYSERETNRLFGGPLTLLFRARQWKPLSDPYQVFVDVFGSDLNLGRPSKGKNMIRALQPTSPAAVVPIRPSVPTSWTTTTTASKAAASSPPGAKPSKELEHTVVCTTTRTLHDRVLIRTETIRQSPRTPPTQGGSEGGSPPPRRSRLITVTSEPILLAEREDSHPASSVFSMCGGGSFWSSQYCDFQLCVWE